MTERFGSSPELNTPTDPDAAEGAAGKPPGTRFRRVLFFTLRQVVVPLTLAVIIALGVQATVAKPYEIPTVSMDPTIKPSDRVLANRFIYHLRDVQRGDIVVFDPPSYLHSDIPFVKRVIGLPGDTVEVRDGRVYVDGQEFLVEGATVARYSYGPEKVPAGQLFVLGDNRNNSLDSHAWGMLPEDQLVGEVFMIYWPPSRMRWF